MLAFGAVVALSLVGLWATSATANDDAMEKIEAALRVKSDDKELETAKKEIAEILKIREEAERARCEA